MSQVYCVTYDVKNPTTSMLENLSGELKNFEAWWHFIDGTWLIRTERNAQSIYAQLRPYIDETVNILIIEVGVDYSGWLPKKAWEWIEQNTRPQRIGVKMPAVGPSPFTKG